MEKWKVGGGGGRGSLFVSWEVTFLCLALWLLFPPDNTKSHCLSKCVFAQISRKNFAYIVVCMMHHKAISHKEERRNMLCDKQSLAICLRGYLARRGGTSCVVNRPLSQVISRKEGKNIFCGKQTLVCYPGTYPRPLSHELSHDLRHKRTVSSILGLPKNAGTMFLSLSSRDCQDGVQVVSSIRWLREWFKDDPNGVLLGRRNGFMGGHPLKQEEWNRQMW